MSVGAGSRARTLLIGVAVWLVVVSIFVTQQALGPVLQGSPGRAGQAALLEVAYWLPWLGLAPLLLALARRFPLSAERWRENVAVHLGLGLGVAVLEALGSAAAQAAVHRTVYPGIPTPGSVSATVPVYTVIALWKYWVFLGITSGFAAAQRAREQAVQAARLESQLAAARLQMLEARLHPHFLFNTLHSASMLTMLDPAAASGLLARLAQLLRHSLRRTPSAEVSLGEELELVERYIEIEKIRFPDRLRVEFDVDPEARAARIPSFLLQPLVENAIRHGIAPTSSAGRLTVRIRAAGEELVVEVDDDGPGPPPDWAIGASGGLGLSTTAARLALLYPGRGRLELARLAPSGCRARVCLPMRAA